MKHELSREMKAIIHLCQFDKRFWEQAQQTIQVQDAKGRHHENINWEFFSLIDFGGVGEGVKSWCWCLYTCEGLTPEIKAKYGFADPFNRLPAFPPDVVKRINEAIKIVSC